MEEQNITVEAMIEARDRLMKHEPLSVEKMTVWNPIRGDYTLASVYYSDVMGVYND